MESKNNLVPDAQRKEFQQQLRSWFQNKGILNKLVLFLRSQMFVEFQKNFLNSHHSQSSLSPRDQAIKLLIADFLLQEGLLFSLSVFCSEVPVLLNLKRYTCYVSNLTNTYKTASAHVKEGKPKFSKKDVNDILEALNLRLNATEVQTVYTIYQSDKFSSFLVCLLYLLPIMLKKNRNVERTLRKTRKKEKYFKKVLKTQKSKVKKMYTLLENTYAIMTKHKLDMVQKQTEIKQYALIMEKRISELRKKEAELNNMQNSLAIKEKELELNYKRKAEEIDKKYEELNEKDQELKNKLKILQEQQSQLELIEGKRAYMLETSKLHEYEEKFRALQEEVIDILKECGNAQHRKLATVPVNKEIQCKFELTNQAQQTEDQDLLNLDEYLHLMEKENMLLKSNSHKQRLQMSELSAETVHLRNKLAYLEKELRLKMERDRRRQMNEVAEKLYSPATESRRLRTPSTSRSVAVRKKLFVESASSDPVTTSGNSKEEEASLTEEIVADAKSKLKELEHESEALNRNFRNLQGVLSRNIVFNERLLQSTSESSSPRVSSARLMRVELTSESSPELRALLGGNVARSPGRVTDNESFRKMYLRYKERSKKRDEAVVILDKGTDSVKEIAMERSMKDELSERLEDGVVRNSADGAEVKSESMGLNVGSAEEVLEQSKETSVKEVAHQIEPEKEAQREISENSHIITKSEGDLSAASANSRSSDFWK